MREDQDAAGAGGLDEAHRGDGLAGAGRVLEPEALVGVRVVEDRGVDVLVGPVVRLVLVGRLRLGGGLLGVVVLVLLVLLVEGRELGRDLLVVGGRDLGRLLLHGEHRRRHVEVRVVAGLVGAQAVREQCRERAGQRVDLVRVERGPVGEMGLLLAEDALEAEHQRPGAPPARRGDLQPAVELAERVVEREPPRGAGGERRVGRLALVQERLAGERLRAGDVARGRNGSGLDGRRVVSHGGQKLSSGGAGARDPAALEPGARPEPDVSPGGPPWGRGPAT